MPIPVNPFVDDARNNRVCIEDGCNRRVKTKGLCNLHHLRKYHQGTGDGKRTGKPKLSNEQVALIKKRSAAFKTQVEIAREFQVSVPTISKVLKGGYVTIEMHENRGREGK